MFTNNSIILSLKTQGLNVPVKLTRPVDYYIIEVSETESISHIWRSFMGTEIGILKNQRYLRDFLRHYDIQYQEFNTAQEMLTSDAPVLFCDTKIDLTVAVRGGKFVITNHAVLMDTIGKESHEAEGYDYVMKDFVFGERSFYINEPVYCCDPNMGDVAPALQRFVKEQDFLDVGETFSPSNERVPGACILAGRQVISLPWKVSEFDFAKKPEWRPYYKKRCNRYAVRWLPNVDFRGFRQLLLALLRYAFRRQDIWMPENHAVNVKMGAQDIEFIYPPQKILDRTARCRRIGSILADGLPVCFAVLLLLALLLFSSVKLAAVMLLLTAAMCAAVWFCGRRRVSESSKASALKYLPIGLTAVVIGINLLYNFRSLPNIYPLYHQSTQARYIPTFMERGEYADSLLQLLVKDKEVQVHDTGDAYEHPVYTYYEEGDPQVKYAVAHDPKYYYGRDYVRFFEAFAGSVSVDETLVSKESFDFSAFQNAEHMTQIGYSNDMARYMFLLNQDEIEQASYFWYDYVYREEAQTMYIYLQNDISPESTSLVALWDAENHLYIMSREYYDEEVKGL